ncbi:uncharacterized protein M8220_001988 [Acridotheres tristis]
MSAKPKLYYFDGRGKMESIRWLLAAAGVEFEEEFLETRDQYEKLLQGGSLLFQQVPMVEIDGMRMVQTRAILSYIAAKYNLYGKDLKERALIDMYVGGTDDLMGFILMFPFLSAEDKEKQHAVIVQKATSRYFPVYEKVLKDHGQDFLVGNNFSWADVHLLEAILMVEEKKSDVLSGFPQLQAFKARISSIPAMKKFLEPGSQRKPVPDDKYVETVRRVLRMYYDVKTQSPYFVPDSSAFSCVPKALSSLFFPGPLLCSVCPGYTHSHSRPCRGSALPCGGRLDPVGSSWIRLEPAGSGCVWLGQPGPPLTEPIPTMYSRAWFYKLFPQRVSKRVVGITGLAGAGHTLEVQEGKVRVPEGVGGGHQGAAGAELSGAALGTRNSKMASNPNFVGPCAFRRCPRWGWLQGGRASRSHPQPQPGKYIRLEKDLKDRPWLVPSDLHLLFSEAGPHALRKFPPPSSSALSHHLMKLISQAFHYSGCKSELGLLFSDIPVPVVQLRGKELREIRVRVTTSLCQFKSLGSFFSLIGYGWKLPQAAEFKQPWGTCVCWVELKSEGKQELRNMSGKPRLTYLNGRGRMESIRWLLAAAGVEFEEVYLETKEQYDKLIKDGFLLFQQVPLVEIDGMKMVQTRAIMSYIAGKYNLYGKDLKERALIDMYVEGISDLMQMILVFPFSPPDAKEKNLESIKERATNRYFPVFEKVLKQHGQDFLVGNKFSWADVQLMEAILAVEEKIPAVLSGFPQLQVFKTKMSNMPTIKKFLQPGSPRKPPPDAHYVETVLKMFKI